MTKAMYPALMRDGGEGGLWAEFRDLPGCFGYGATAIECVRSASDALETHLAAMEADGVALPPRPTPAKRTAPWRGSTQTPPRWTSAVLR